MTGSYFQLFAVSAVVMGISYTIAKERIFAPLREKLGGRETFFGYLVSCPFCASHYVAFVLVPLTRSYFLRVPYQWGVLTTLLDWFLSSMLVVVIAAFLRVGFFFIDETQGLVRRRQKTEEVEREVLEKQAKAENREAPRVH